MKKTKPTQYLFQVTLAKLGSTETFATVCGVAPDAATACARAYHLAAPVGVHAKTVILLGKREFGE